MIAGLIIGLVIGAGAAAWALTADRRREPNRDAHMFRLGVEAQKDAEAIGASKAHHPAYAGGPVPTRPTLVADVINLDTRRRGPEPAA